jgi:hypothetical protein
VGYYYTFLAGSVEIRKNYTAILRWEGDGFLRGGYVQQKERRSDCNESTHPATVAVPPTLAVYAPRRHAVP